MENVFKFFGRQLRSKEFWIKVLFIGISLVFWLLIKLSKSGYVTTVEYPVLYENIPQNKVMLGDVSHNITLRISSFGFRLLGYEWSADNMLKIDVKRHVRKAPGRDDVYYWLPNLYTEEFENQLDGQTSLLRIEPDTVFLTMSEMVSKKVPVQPEVLATFQPGFKAYGKAKSNPQLISISGPKLLIDSINSLRTKPFEFEDLDKTESRKLEIDFSNDFVKIKPKKVNVTMPVAQVTEKQLTVMVRLVNVPSGYSATIIPKKVKINCSVAVQDEATLFANDIELVCDFAQLQEFPDRKRLLLKTVTSSKPFEIQSVSHKSVDYLLFKK